MSKPLVHPLPIGTYVKWRVKGYRKHYSGLITNVYTSSRIITTYTIDNDSPPTYVKECNIVRKLTPTETLKYMVTLDPEVR